MKTKEEVIKIAYGIQWDNVKDYVDENIVEREFPHPKFTLEFNKEWWLKYVTHYQEKIVPHKPLHK